jgi:hypothetical protein
VGGTGVTTSTLPEGASVLVGVGVASLFPRPHPASTIVNIIANAIWKTLFWLMPVPSLNESTRRLQ